MSAERALFDAYAEWHRLAKAGNKAIHKRDWNFLLECQARTRTMQPVITKLTQAARNEWKQGADCAQMESRLGSIISELKTILESNQKLLRTARSTALCKRDMLGQAERNLKRLQNSYVVTPRSAWTSMS